MKFFPRGGYYPNRITGVCAFDLWNVNDMVTYHYGVRCSLCGFLALALFSTPVAIPVISNRIFFNAMYIALFFLALLFHPPTTALLQDD